MTRRPAPGAQKRKSGHRRGIGPNSGTRRNDARADAPKLPLAATDEPRRESNPRPDQRDPAAVADATNAMRRLGLPMNAPQDQKFAVNAAHHPPTTFAEAYAALPGCPTATRWLALVSRGSPLIDEHCRLTGDDRDELLAALYRRLEAEQDRDRS